MGFTTRDFNTMVEAICDRIIAANVGFTNKSKGSVLRILVEAIAAEMDIQYYQLSNVYASKSIDTTSGDDLDAIVSILGVHRNDATAATGVVTFGRAVAYGSDIIINAGTVVSTRVDASGNIIEFTVDSDTTLVAGQLTVNANVTAVVPAAISITAGHVTVMSDPVIGIEYVTNGLAITGGTDEETDDQLRARAKLALDGLGKGTGSALESAVKTVDDVIDAIVIDQNRGVATSDVVVVCASMPPSQATADAITAVVAATKASGIDVDIVYPTSTALNVSVTTNNAYNADTIGNTIRAYFDTIGIGDPFINHQLTRLILNAINDLAADITALTPNNTTPGATEILRCGTITINGVVWNG